MRALTREQHRHPHYGHPHYRHPYYSHPREEISNEGFFSNPLDLLENPILFENPLSQGAQIAIGLGALAALGVGAYFLFRPKTAAAATATGIAPCTGGWQPVAANAARGPGHYRLAMVMGTKGPTSQADFTSGVQQLVAIVSGYAPGITIEGIWSGSYSYPQGTPLPSDFQCPAGSVCIQLLNPYNLPSLAPAMPASAASQAQVWSCASGPVPATQPIPPALQQLLQKLQQPPTGFTTTLNVQPGDNGTVNLPAQGGIVAVTLPQGATYSPGSTQVAVPTSGTTSTASYVINYSTSSGQGSDGPAQPAFLTGTNTLTVNWTDASGQPQVSTLTVVVS